MWNKYSKTKKQFIACSTLIINELRSFQTRLENFRIAKIEYALLAVFTNAFCFSHAEHNLIKVKSYSYWSAQAVNNILENAMSNWIKPIELSHV